MTVMLHKAGARKPLAVRSVAQIGYYPKGHSGFGGIDGKHACVLLTIGKHSLYFTLVEWENTVIRMKDLVDENVR